MIPNTPIRADRIAADIDALAAITEPGRPWTRRAFTPMFLEGRKWLERAMQDAGAVTRIDAAGNLIGTIPGKRPELGTTVYPAPGVTVAPPAGAAPTQAAPAHQRLAPAQPAQPQPQTRGTRPRRARARSAARRRG